MGEGKKLVAGTSFSSFHRNSSF